MSRLSRHRELARAIVIVRNIEAVGIHVTRDKCMSCFFFLMTNRKAMKVLVPKRYTRDPEWVHKYIEAPAVRMFARKDDAERYSHE